MIDDFPLLLGPKIKVRGFIGIDCSLPKLLKLASSSLVSIGASPIRNWSRKSMRTSARI